MTAGSGREAALASGERVFLRRIDGAWRDHERWAITREMVS